MKRLSFLASVVFVVVLQTTFVCAQGAPTSSQRIEAILSEPSHRSEIIRIRSGISAVLADQRLTDQAVRQMLQESKTVLNELLEQKSGSNVEKLVEFLSWMQVQALQRISIHDSGGSSTPQQQFAVDNCLAGEDAYLASITYRILSEYVDVDKAGAGSGKLEGYLQLYLRMRSTVEGATGVPEGLLLRAPVWTQGRFPQLNADQKRQFLKDSTDARAERALGPGADEVPASPPTPAEEAAYESAYQFVVSNTPPMP